ncbi:actin-related protein [Flagelloscypha sp. PMI_526]|nr:actin-related protein [Flagelloscypha sp. PMI_526]
MGFRDNAIVVIETSRTVVRAGLGLHELLKTPTVEVLARVGYRGSSTSTAINDNTHPGPSSTTTTLPQKSFPGAAVNDFLVGSSLDDALASDPDIPISWPFADGDVFDWTQAEAIWKHTLFKGIQLRRAQMESPALLSVPLGLSRDSLERICQIFFERFNVAAFSIIERPISQILATTSPSGVVVDIGSEITDVTPVYDVYPNNDAAGKVRLGIRDCENYLAHILRTNQSIGVAGFGGDSEEDRSARLELVPSTGEAAQPEDEGVTDIAAIVMAGKEKAVIEAASRKKQNARATAADLARAKEIEALDLLTVQFREHTLTLGKERHRFHEPLFDPSLLNSIPGYEENEVPTPLQDVVAQSIRSIVDISQRQHIWQALFVTGDATKTIQGLGIALQSRVQHHLTSEHIPTEIQPKVAKVINMPDYYAEYSKTGDAFAAFLGSSITCKGRTYVSKADYSSMGPRSVLVFSPALL